MCYSLKAVKYGAASLGLIGPGTTAIQPPERLAIDDLPPVSQVQIVEVPVLDTTEIVVQKPVEPRQAAITPDPVPTITSGESTPGRLPAPDRLPSDGRRWIGDQRLCRAGYC